MRQTAPRLHHISVWVVRDSTELKQEIANSVTRLRQGVLARVEDLSARVESVRRGLIPERFLERLSMKSQAIGALLELLPGDLRLLVDNGQFAWKDFCISIQQVEDGQFMPQPFGRISLTLLLGEGVPALYQFSVRLLPCHSCHSLPCHLGDSSVEGHPKHSFLMRQ